ncbi:hypothetical protein N7519_001193 [Penicillium mononematosum]|uniref:uncharacterized protein n=1 Tax=Penicillium mononematosum TaxID=268346 RepID=UPI002547AA0D|nr:uncharacterized protein N7519_001193 [Penicillium mononematosum]KAJ6191172.1 hypothetical protein N7519_001193 [Penicillium mononematosum]
MQYTSHFKDFRYSSGLRLGAALVFEAGSLQQGPVLFSRVVFRRSADAIVFEDLDGLASPALRKHARVEPVPIRIRLDSIRGNGTRLSVLICPFASKIIILAGDSAFTFKAVDKAVTNSA